MRTIYVDADACPVKDEVYRVARRYAMRVAVVANVPLRVPAVPYRPFVAVVDWNGDGDPDLIVGTAYGYFSWFERSFLERGYAKAERVQRRPP